MYLLYRKNNEGELEFLNFFKKVVDNIEDDAIIDSYSQAANFQNSQNTGKTTPWKLTSLKNLLLLNKEVKESILKKLCE